MPFHQPLEELHVKIMERGGYLNAHAHLDRAYTVENLKHSNLDLKDKWHFIDQIKSDTTEQQYYNRIRSAIEMQFTTNKMTRIVSFIDVDPVVKDKALRAAVRVRDEVSDQGIDFRIACQTLKGVLSRESRYWFDLSLEQVDIIGGLPAADAGREKEHMTALLEASKKTGLPVHVHVDQNDRAEERETEMLARLTIDKGCEGRVCGVHGISIAARPESQRRRIYKIIEQSGMGMIACPSAWIDRRRREDLLPVHNSVMPVDEMCHYDIPIFMGTDNICDVYKPYCDGDLKVEMRFLLESLHFYWPEKLVEIATGARSEGYF